MKVYYSPAYVAAQHDFDTTRKAGWIAASLRAWPVAGVELVAPTAVTANALARVHDARYVQAVRAGLPRALAESQGFAWDPGLWSAMTASTGGAVAAALHALATRENAGSLSSGLHHARREHGAGCCTFNGLALAALAALDAGARSVLIVDLDAHCGGGTYEILADEPRVLCMDIAVEPSDWYTPSRSTWTLDIVDRAELYLATVSARLLAACVQRPDLILYNAGMDPYGGGLPDISAGLLAVRERLVFEIARDVGTPVAFVLAGGYVGPGLFQEALVDLHRLTITEAARC